MRPAVAALVAALAFAAQALAQEEPLPRPATLEPAIRFWTRVYTEVEVSRGLIHDAEHLDVVYAVIDVPRSMSSRNRERRVEQEKARVRAALRTLASGKRSGLSSLEAEVLARWPEGVSNATLRHAVDQVRFQLGQADRYREGLIRSGRWRDYIARTMVAHGVPVELAALPHVESSFNPDAYSRIGAAGLWQFTRSTGRLFLHVDDVLDERLDPHRATVAAARLLKKNYELTGAWPLAITSYNHGAGGMQRAARTLGTRDIGRIVREYKGRTFGFASRNFYTSFMAALHVDRNAARYFGNVQYQAPVEFEQVELPYYYPARSLARALGVDMGMLRESNPALRPSVWQGTKHVPRGYDLQLPAGVLTRPASQLLAQVPEGDRLVAQHRDRYYRVRRGDTLSRIASRHGTSESRLMAVNNLRSRNLIRAGQVLVLPDGGVTYVVASNTPERITAEAENTLAAAVPPEAPDPAPAGGVYAVRRGDTLASIARRFGTTESELARINGLRNRNRIHAGQSLRVPGAVAVVASADSAEIATPAPPPAPAPAPAAPPVTEPSPRAADVVIEALAAETPVSPDPVQRQHATPEPIAEPPADAKIEVPVRVAADDAPTIVDADALVDQASAETEAAAEDEAAGEPADAEPGAEEVEVASVPPSAEAPAEAGAPSDPSDYAVHADGRVTVQATETLGHYAEWLEVSASALRNLNRMRAKSPIVIGRSVKLDFRRVTPEEFERRRLSYHRTLQSEFFEHFQVTGTEQHVLRKGETVWFLAARKYRVPVWLLRQYNPDLDFGALPAGAQMVVPQIEPRAEPPAADEG
jgi:membrane-bound lytic murein transglycosylase D